MRDGTHVRRNDRVKTPVGKRQLRDRSDPQIDVGAAAPSREFTGQRHEIDAGKRPIGMGRAQPQDHTPRSATGIEDRGASPERGRERTSDMRMQRPEIPHLILHLGEFDIFVGVHALRRAYTGSPSRR